MEWQPVLKFRILFITDTDMNTDIESCVQQWMRGVRKRWWWELMWSEDVMMTAKLSHSSSHRSVRCQQSVIYSCLHFAWHLVHPFHTLSRSKWSENAIALSSFVTSSRLSHPILPFPLGFRFFLASLSLSTVNLVTILDWEDLAHL